MEILNGLLKINGADAYGVYGVFLSENDEGEHRNYNELMRPAPSKKHTCVSFREKDGEDYPDTLMPALQARDIELRFTLEAESREDFLTKYSAFIQMLRNGDDGWLILHLAELDRSYRVFYLDCTEWDQLTGFEGKVYASFTVKFREPVPAY